MNSWLGCRNPHLFKSKATWCLVPVWDNPARDIAAACLTMVEATLADPARRGIYHISGSPDTSWADFARAIMAQAKLTCLITDITTADYPTPAARPAIRG